VRWSGWCDPHLYLSLAAGGAAYGPVAVDEAPIAADPFGNLLQIDVSRPLARWAREKRTHPVVDQLAEVVDRDGISGLVHGVLVPFEARPLGLTQRLPGFSLIVRPAVSQSSSPGRLPRADGPGLGRRVRRMAIKPHRMNPTRNRPAKYVQGIHPAAIRKAEMPAAMKSRAMSTKKRDAIRAQRTGPLAVPLPFRSLQAVPQWRFSECPRVAERGDPTQERWLLPRVHAKRHPSDAAPVTCEDCSCIVL
jgi:hypothetical protein